MAELSDMTMQEVAAALVAKPKGILAADESGGSTEKRFAQFGIESTEENRRQYRQLFFTTPDIEAYISGIILFDETARQKSDEGELFPDLITRRGMIPGIKVDKGLEPLPEFEGETVTSGLDGLQARLGEYKAMGLQFAKWRAALKIGENMPSPAAVVANAHALARYAADCQAAGIVPIVEPEVTLDGDHTLEQCKEVLADVLDELFVQLDLMKVDLEATILKTSMVLSGKEAPQQATTDEVAAATVEVLTGHVPQNLAGIVFLSGGQEVEQATENLQAITNLGPFPWNVSFSYARALQIPAIEKWLGQPDNIPAAQEAFFERVKANSRATKIS